MIFVQFADAHLDSSISGRLNLPPEKKDVLRGDIRKAVTSACDLARDAKANLLLIPGDLFDYERLTTETVAFMIDLMRQLAPTHVFIAPGNHDSLRPGSPYNSASGIKWPENVHIFRSEQFETVEIEDLDCAVTGIGHIHRGVTDRLLAKPIERVERSVNILLFHGSRDGYRPTEKEVVIPFSDAELLAQGFTYAAIGHYHSLGIIEDAGVRAAYSGCVQGRGLDEAGMKCAIVGEIEGGRVKVQTIEVAERRVCRVECDVTGAQDSAAASNRISDAVAAAGARACDVVHIALTGRMPPETQLDLSALESSSDFFHVNIDPRAIEPDYDLEALSLESAAEKLKSAFVQRMREIADGADDNERRALRDATYYGLYALDGRKLEPRDAD